MQYLPSSKAESKFNFAPTKKKKKDLILLFEKLLKEKFLPNKKVIKKIIINK